MGFWIRLGAVAVALLVPLHETANTAAAASNLISKVDKYESLLWDKRGYTSDVALDIDAFASALQQTSAELCDLGITATILDADGAQVYQATVGSRFGAPSGYLETADPRTDWTGDTPMLIYSNSKTLVAVAYLAAVVEQGLGFLDEPIYRAFPEYLSKNDPIGKATPKMLLSHSSGLAEYNRADPETDPYFNCKYDPNTTLAECLGDNLLTNTNPTPTKKNATVPGTTLTYNNAAFDVMAELIVRKTGLSNYGEVLEEYVTGPIGMKSTTIDCPGVRSTAEKPHVSWGICSTAHDMAKFVQVLANRGRTTDGRRILTEQSLFQMFSPATGTASGAAPGNTPINMPSYTRCTQSYVPGVGQMNSMYGYGLGTMIFLGTKGHYYGHAGSTGGFWFVSPGKFSGYMGWMDKGLLNYQAIANLVDTLELASTFRIAHSSTQTDSNGVAGWEEVGIKTCGDGLYNDIYGSASNAYNLIDAVEYVKRAGVTEETLAGSVCLASPSGGRRQAGGDVSMTHLLIAMLMPMLMLVIG